MTPEQFAYWLQGFVEMNNKSHHPTPRQWDLIKKNLKKAFSNKDSADKVIHDTNTD